MKILIVSTHLLKLPISNYGGIEALTYQQAVGLHAKGHQVAIVAPEGSTMPNGIELIPTGVGEDEKSAYSKYWHRLPEFDVICDSTWQHWPIILKAEGKLKAPVLIWCHCPVNTLFGSRPPIEKPCFVCISKDMCNHIKEYFPGCDARLCYNGVPVDKYRKLDLPRNDNYLFLARFSSIKGADIAAAACKNTGVFCDFIGDDTITGEPEYVNNITNECALNPKLRMIGPQSREQCEIWFNRNKCLLHPVQRYREPFGLTLIESQLTGMPIISWNHGSPAELICTEDGPNRTGFLVNSQEEMEHLIRTNAVANINPQRCREWASQFSYENMINRVEELCHEAISTGGW